MPSSPPSPGDKGRGLRWSGPDKEAAGVWTSGDKGWLGHVGVGVGVGAQERTRSAESCRRLWEGGRASPEGGLDGGAARQGSPAPGGPKRLRGLGAPAPHLVNGRPVPGLVDLFELLLHLHGGRGRLPASPRPSAALGRVALRPKARRPPPPQPQPPEPRLLHVKPAAGSTHPASP